MLATLKLPSDRMTVGEFLDWDFGADDGRAWQLRDGKPEMMAPDFDPHGSIQSLLCYFLIAHLDAHASQCRVVTTPGVVPHRRSEENCLVPDLGITCASPSGARLMTEPVVLIEILSPSNEPATWANVEAYTTIPTVREIAVLRSTSVSAEMLRRRPDGSWQERAETIDADGVLRIDSIGYAGPLRLFYRTTALR